MDGWISTIFHIRTMEDDNERLCAMAASLESFPPTVGLKPGTARSVGQRLTN